MAKDKSNEVPVVTVSARGEQRNPGFKNPNKAIQVAPGFTLQDVPRGMIMQHLRDTENFWKGRFAKKYAGMNPQQSY